MSILALILFLSVVIPDSPAIINDNQSNYNNGIIVNQDLTNDVQVNYNNGILIIKSSVLQDSETITQQQEQSNQSNSGSSGSGGGGGGDGITSTENFSNIIQFEQHEGTLITNQPTSFKFNLSVYEILLTGKENEYDVSVRVELLKDKPQKAIIKPEGVVIQYFNVVTSTKRMKEAVIRFKSISGVKLLKWHNSEWVEVHNNYYPNPDADYVHYIAETDSFSSFAIVAREQPTQVYTILPTEVPTPLPTPLPTSTPKQASGFSVFIAIMVIVVVIFKNGK